MRPFIDSQALTSRFNEDEAVWSCYDQLRNRYRLRGSSSPLSEEILDRLDWLEAERECRERRYVGRSAEEAVKTKAGLTYAVIKIR